MIIRNGIDGLVENLSRQYYTYFGRCNMKIIDELEDALKRLEKILNSISRSNTYVWSKEDEATFSPYNSVQYSIFLYLLAKSVYKRRGRIEMADNLFYLNKIMHACDWFYEVQLPSLFFSEHVIGSVIGRAEFGERFHFYQGVTVGGQYDKYGKLKYPSIGDNVRMYANSSIIGASVIGNNVIISAGCLIINCNVPDNCIVYGRVPDLHIKECEPAKIKKMLSDVWDFSKV